MALGAVFDAGGDVALGGAVRDADCGRVVGKLGDHVVV